MVQPDQGPHLEGLGPWVGWCDIAYEWGVIDLDGKWSALAPEDRQYPVLFLSGLVLGARDGGHCGSSPWTRWVDHRCPWRGCRTDTAPTCRPTRSRTDRRCSGVPGSTAHPTDPDRPPKKAHTGHDMKSQAPGQIERTILSQDQSLAHAVTAPAHAECSTVRQRTLCRTLHDNTVSAQSTVARPFASLHELARPGRPIQRFT